jgi:uncharacterized protein (DUF1697 family)
MAHVVFLHGANVGGRNIFRPARLAAALGDLDVVNVGAAGTFVVRAKVAAAAVRREILGRLKFAAGIAVLPGSRIEELVRSRPFHGVAFRKDLRGWVAVLHGRPKKRPALPFSRPEGAGWTVRLDRVEGAFALGLWHFHGKFVIPSLVVEEALGVPATVRWWETMERVAGILQR